MEKKIVMSEVYGAQDLKALEGCTITSVTGLDEEGAEGVCIDCRSNDGNLVIFMIQEDGTMNFYNGKKKSITADQLGELAMLSGCSDIDSVHFNNLEPLVEIIIKPIGNNAADRVMTMLKGIFSGLGVRDAEWNHEGKRYPMYCCSDQDYNFHITVAVMPKDIIKGIGGN